MSHLDHLRKVVKFGHHPILDVGAGKGDFVLSAAREGLNAIGLEFNPKYIEEAMKKAEAEHLRLEMIQGTGELLPFPDGMFGFVNLSEVVEHVRDPFQVISEVHRVLLPGGHVYISAPNRFGIRDPHFHLYFINWLPRSAAHRLIGMLGKHKEYTSEAGLQRIDEMHYYTFDGFRRLLNRAGFSVRDIREERIRREFQGLARASALLGYRMLLRPLWFDTAHIVGVKARTP